MAKFLYSIVGMKHRGTETFVKEMAHGEQIELIREPTNPYDRNAVQVWACGQHLGFIKATQAKPLAAAMDAAGQSNIVGRYIASTSWPQVEVGE